MRGATGAHESVDAALMVDEAAGDEDGKNEIGSKDAEGLRQENECNEPQWVEQDQGKDSDVDKHDSVRLGR